AKDWLNRDEALVCSSLNQQTPRRPAPRKGNLLENCRWRLKKGYPKELHRNESGRFFVRCWNIRWSPDLEVRMRNDLVDFSDVTKQFHHQRAVDQFSVRFKSGTTVGLLGPNGAGKTTCLKMMLGTMRPTTGSIRIFGTDVSSNSAALRQQIGYVPEDPWLYP